MDASTGFARSQSLKPLGSLGRDEMNLAEFPITLLTDRVPKDQKEAVYQDEIYDERTGLTLSRKLTIQAGNYGLTTAVDDEVILALIQITKHKNNFINRKVQFSRLELIQMLGWPGTGASYERILLSLQKWTSVYLQYENAWRDNRSKAWTTKGFHIVESFELNDSRHSDDLFDLIPSYIVWGTDIFESFQAGYLKPLDYDFCMGLSNSTAKRMYRFLDKRFHHKTDWSFDLKELAHEHIGLGRNYDGPAHLKRKLRPAIAELEAVGFLEPLTEDQRFLKDGRDWKIRLVARMPIAALPLPEVGKEQPDESPLAAELTLRGVTKITAVELVQHQPAELIERQLEFFDWQMKKKPEKIGEPAGYLVAAIKKDYAAPKGFVPKAERQRREEARKGQERQAAEHHRSQQRQKAAEESKQVAVEAYIKQLSPVERMALETDALAQASSEARENYESPGMARYRDTLMLGLLREHVRQVFNSRESAPADA